MYYCALLVETAGESVYVGQRTRKELKTERQRQKWAQVLVGIFDDGENHEL